nr:hypothetical protein GCM10025732_45400 [Glycomyces mayteni]
MAMSGFMWSLPQRSQQEYWRAAGEVAVPWAPAPWAVKHSTAALAMTTAASLRRSRRRRGVLDLSMVSLPVVEDIDKCKYYRHMLTM